MTRGSYEIIQVHEEDEMFGKTVLLKTLLLSFCLCIFTGIAPAKDKKAPAKAADKVAATQVIAKTVVGDVKLIPAGTMNSVKLNPGTALTPLDTLKTGKASYAVISIGDSSEIRLNQETKFHFTSYNDTLSKDAISAIVESGQIWARIGNENRLVFHMRSSMATVKDSEVDIKVKSDGEVAVILYEGAITVQNEAGRVELSQPKKSDICQVTSMKSGQTPPVASQVQVSSIAQWQNSITGKGGEKKPEDRKGKKAEKKSEGKLPETGLTFHSPAPADQPLEEASPSAP